MPAGRPLIIPTPEEFQARVDAYFAMCEEQKRPQTVTGLALALGLCGRKVLDDYEGREQFSDIVKKARSRVEMAYEERLSGTAPAGSIFALKNMGWSDKHELEHGGKNGGPIEYTRVIRRIVDTADGGSVAESAEKPDPAMT